MGCSACGKPALVINPSAMNPEILKGQRQWVTPNAPRPLSPEQPINENKTVGIIDNTKPTE